jgi:hypothetical protein
MDEIQKSNSANASAQEIQAILSLLGLHSKITQVHIGLTCAAQSA